MYSDGCEPIGQPRALPESYDQLNFRVAKRAGVWSRLWAWHTRHNSSPLLHLTSRASVWYTVAPECFVSIVIRFMDNATYINDARARIPQANTPRQAGLCVVTEWTGYEGTNADISWAWLILIIVTVININTLCLISRVSAIVSCCINKRIWHPVFGHHVIIIIIIIIRWK